MRLIEFAGARRIPLVGRQELLKEADRRIGRGGVHLLYFEGGGGIGKTALLEAILEQSQRGDRANALPSCRVASKLIDLYHADVHTSEGLIRNIVEVLGKWSFEGTQEVLAALEQARASGDADMANDRANALRVLFLEEFMALTEEGVVLAFDTLEMLEYEHDPFQEELGAEMPILSAGEWLFRSFFPALSGNVVVLLAGRPTGLGSRLEALREQHPRLLVQPVRLEALDEEETKEYFKAVAQAEAKRGDGDAAALLWGYCEERIDVIHFLTGGRPILLALLADIVGHGWALPSPFDQSRQELELRDEVVLLHEVERALAVRIQASPTPMGETLRALAWLQKGATPELVARVMGLKTAEGEWDVYTATGYLDQVVELALVKVRPGDRRIFLHDEMYALLEVHILQEAAQEETDRIYDSIQEYYRGEIEDIKRRIEKFPSTLVIMRARLRQALAEQMHYRMRHCPPLGFALYFYQAEEALGGRDTEMDMLLRTECLRTIGMLEANGYFAGFVPREAEIDAAVRWGMRSLFFQGDPERALDIFDEIRRRWGQEAGKLGLAWVHMQLYSAVAKIQRAYGEDWREARVLLENVVQRTDEVLRSPAENPVVEARHWRAKIIKGLALNFRGYLDRQQGRYLEAVRHYQESAMLQRRLEMAALVPTLTNLSYAMALIGQSHRARLLVEEAERLALRGGQEHMLAVTLNVRALVELYDDHHRTALHYADRALKTAVNLPTFRVRGLVYLTRAKAQRYLWHSLTEEEKREDLDLLDETLKDANQAVTMLRNSPSDRIDALLERARVYGEIARMHHARGEVAETRQNMQKSRADFDRAAVLAGAIDVPGQQALAWTDMGWLYYSLGDLTEVQVCIQQMYVPFPGEYLFPSRGPVPVLAQNGGKNEASLHYWSTLGKAELLKASIALDKALTGGDQNASNGQLKAAVKHISLCLAYNKLISDEHFDLTRAEEWVHKRILQDRLSIEILHKYAQEIAEESELAQPTCFQEFLNRMFGPRTLWT